MLHKDEIIKMRNDAKSTIELAIKCAEKGHNHIVQNHSISSIKLLELTSELLNFRNKFGEFEGIKE